MFFIDKRFDLCAFVDNGNEKMCKKDSRILSFNVFIVLVVWWDGREKLQKQLHETLKATISHAESLLKPLKL